MCAQFPKKYLERILEKNWMASDNSTTRFWCKKTFFKKCSAWLNSKEKIFYTKLLFLMLLLSHASIISHKDITISTFKIIFDSLSSRTNKQSWIPHLIKSTNIFNLKVGKCQFAYCHFDYFLFCLRWFAYYNDLPSRTICLLPFCLRWFALYGDLPTAVSTTRLG